MAITIPATGKQKILSDSLEKRIKRNVSGRKHNFFTITAPGLEVLCQKELQLIPFFGEESSIVQGGIDFSGRLYECYLANLYLRTATRILMRIETLVATNFTVLSKKLSFFPWELYLFPDSVPFISVSVNHCRLYHKDAIISHFEESIRNRLSQFKNHTENPETHPIQRIFVRGLDDHFVVSIDSSGDLLYKRGIKKLGGIAPVRETLAAAILMLAGYTGNEPLLDPMSGSGSFAIEGSLIAQNIPPGWFRSFAFTGWPGFKPSQFNHIRKAAREGFNTKDVHHIFALDESPKVCSALDQIRASNPFLTNIHVIEKDFFDLIPHEILDKSGLVVMNPPYGKRMGSRNESRIMIREIMKKLKADFRGWKFSVIVPQRSDILHVSSGWRFHSIFHGGMNLELVTGKI